MKYDLTNPESLKKALAYFHMLQSSGAKCEIKKIHPKRSLSQNRYLHLLFGKYGLEFGWTIEEAKLVVKEQLGYSYEKNGKVFSKSTADMNTKELTDFIDKFRNMSATQGCYLPRPDEINFDLENEIQQYDNYLNGRF